MKTAKLIKREEQVLPPNQPVARAQPPITRSPTMREVVAQWVQEHKIARPTNPRKEFAALFISSPQTVSA